MLTLTRLPEPRGRSFAELDMLFEKGVSARKFASTKIDVFEGTNVESTDTLHRYESKIEHEQKMSEKI
jgi:SP family general alpha glucoside:H+ symporter-like MFS transporter